MPDGSLLRRQSKTDPDLASYREESKNNRSSSTIVRRKSKPKTKTDIAAWGLYTEYALPCLPLDACFPGLEVQQLLEDLDGLLEHSDAEESESSGDNEAEISDVAVGNRVARRSRTVSRPRLPTTADLVQALPSFLLTTTSHSNTTDRQNAERKKKMAPKTHVFLSLWFLLTAPVIFWDAGYCFMR